MANASNAHAQQSELSSCDEDQEAAETRDLFAQLSNARNFSWR